MPDPADPLMCRSPQLMVLTLEMTRLSAYPSVVPPLVPVMWIPWCQKSLIVTLCSSTPSAAG